jgi:superfamily II DNA helicase RecQ
LPEESERYVDEQLKELVGDEARFRSVQRPAVHAIMRQKNPIVAIIGTGAGKSVLFMVPTLCLTDVSVVIVPLILLRQDISCSMKSSKMVLSVDP